MASGLRPVELIEADVNPSAANIQRARHVVGVDESGNAGGEPLVLTAVQCPRTGGEKLAELLIDLGLEPWKSKSSSTPAQMSNRDLSAKVEALIQQIEDTRVTWHAVGEWGAFNKQQRGAIAAIVSSKAMTGGGRKDIPPYDGPAAIVHDGGDLLYGKRQIEFRRYASRQFAGFGDRVTPVYLSFLPDGDMTYPEITAADYIAGYIKSEIERHGLDAVPHVQRIDDSWRASNEPPETLYRLRPRNRHRTLHKEERVASWIDGRSPPKEAGTWGESPLEALVDRLHSQRVKDYILQEL